MTEAMTKEQAIKWLASPEEPEIQGPGLDVTEEAIQNVIALITVNGTVRIRNENGHFVSKAELRRRAIRAVATLNLDAV